MSESLFTNNSTILLTACGRNFKWVTEIAVAQNLKHKDF